MISRHLSHNLVAFSSQLHLSHVSSDYLNATIIKTFPWKITRNVVGMQDNREGGMGRKM